MASKKLTVVGGANGSGKTTFAQEYIKQTQQPYLSADLIASQMAPDDPASVQIAAGRKFLQRLDEFIAGSESFIVESTLSGRTFRRTLQKAKNAGFEIIILFVFLDSPDSCVARVQQRVRKGGHHVPEADIRRRFSRSLANFWQIYRKMADRWLLIYNVSNESQDVAFGTADSISIRHETLFKKFSLQDKKVRLRFLRRAKGTISAETYAEIDELIRIANRAVHRAQEESRQLGVPNVYSFNGILYYELPNGELSRVDPYQKGSAA